MKNYLLLVLCLLSLGLKAQKLTVGKVAYINLPKNAKAINGSQLLAKSTAIMTEADIKHLPKTHNLYEKDGVAIGLWEMQQGDTKRSLEEIQKESEGMFKTLKTKNVLVSSNIQKYKGTKYLILQIKDGDFYYYRFYSDQHNYLSVNGFIKYKKEDNDKANAILKELLNNTQFKN
ncbi:hypothetical protein [Pedobacter frigoris]|uniref:hypothetical protein n=1 Tax=Pedobacter frigoris TaxID=2571272 RepID=UPI00292E0124|nr:hypothetical protein [Pedobacter frigoris]